MNQLIAEYSEAQSNFIRAPWQEAAEDQAIA